RYLECTFPCVLENDDLRVFDLRRNLAANSTVLGSLDLQETESQDRDYPPADLRHFERRVSSQNGEDGILEEILRRVGTKIKYFVEFGVESGRECNCARLVREEDWHGLFIEPDPELFAELR